MSTLPCRFNPVTGAVANFSGQAIGSCADCDCCDTKSFRQNSGLISGTLNCRVTNVGCDYRIEWDCPDCGRVVHEDCTPINAIPLSEKIAADPLCASCRRLC